MDGPEREMIGMGPEVEVGINIIVSAEYNGSVPVMRLPPQTLAS